MYFQGKQLLSNLVINVMCHLLTNLNQFSDHLVSKGSFSFHVLTIVVSRGRHPFDHDSSCVYVADQKKGELCEQEFLFYWVWCACLVLYPYPIINWRAACGGTKLYLLVLFQECLSMSSVIKTVSDINKAALRDQIQVCKLRLLSAK